MSLLEEENAFKVSHKAAKSNLSFTSGCIQESTFQKLSEDPKTIALHQVFTEVKRRNIKGKKRFFKEIVILLRIDKRKSSRDNGLEIFTPIYINLSFLLVEEEKISKNRKNQLQSRNKTFCAIDK